VGQSKHPHYRWRCHQRAAILGKIHPLYCALKYHGVEAFEFLLLEECDESSSDDRERYWIFSLRTRDRQFGYNIEEGGNGGKTLSDETRRKMSISRQGKQPALGHKHSSETKQRMSLAHRGHRPYVMTDEVRQKISEALVGENHPNYNKKRPIEVGRKVSQALNQPVERLDELGNVIASYESAKEASEHTGVSRSVISAECKLQRQWRKVTMRDLA